MLAPFLINLSLTFVLFFMMAAKYRIHKDDVSLGWAIMFLVMVLWNISLYISEHQLLPESIGGGIFVTISCYLGISIFYAAIRMMFGEVKTPMKQVLVFGIILAPIYAFVAMQIIPTYTGKLLPAALLIAGSELVSGFILLRYFKWEGKSAKIKTGVVSISLSLFVLSMNTINYLFNILPGAVDKVSVPLLFSAVSKVLFFVGVICALL